MQGMVAFLRNSYTRATAVLNRLQSPLLLAIRLYWGWQFCEDGWGKLTHLGKVTDFFTSLNLPAPHATAILVALVELCGGALFFLGLGTRLVSLVLFVNMTVAFLAAEKDAFLSLFSDPDKFQAASAYNDWLAALLILIFGPGAFALDWLLARRAKASATARAA
ncbi:MAG TPA: DoxX family protein [Terracidiphilus sp.]|nr:DoxX family protein [Terracidiphilus sp.]